MKHLTSEKTIDTKPNRSIKQFASNYGVHIKAYPADNGRFADNTFRASCEQQQHALTFCGLNAHFQNGIAERAIRDITEAARTMLLHAIARWPGHMHCAVHLHNTVPVLLDGTSRLERFSGVNVGSRMKDNHTFGCPVFALQNDLAVQVGSKGTIKS
jgi:hypothetical protein